MNKPSETSLPSESVDLNPQILSALADISKQLSKMNDRLTKLESGMKQQSQLAAEKDEKSRHRSEQRFFVIPLAVGLVTFCGLGFLAWESAPQINTWLRSTPLAQSAK
jgi:hypothetical protein